MESKKMWWLAELFAAVALSAAFAAILCFGRPSILDSFDYVLFYKPNFRFLSDAMFDGRLPLWNPFIGLGRPFLADSQNATFYPPVYVVCLGLEFGVFVLVWSHSLLAVSGFKSFARTLKVGRWQSYFMAFSFLASGALMARWSTGQILYCCGICYVPWLFYFTMRLHEPWSTSRVGCHALLLALQFLCGHPQVFWVSCIGQVAFVVARGFGLPLRRALRDGSRELCQFTAAGVWSLGLTAVVLLPFLELVGQGNRGGASRAFADFCRLEWSDLWSLVLPLGANPMYAVNWEANLFIGPVLLALGVLGFSSLPERNVRGLLGVLLIGMLISLAGNTPVFELFYRFLPGFSSLRVHSRAGLLIVFALVCGAGVFFSRPHPALRAMILANFNLPAKGLKIGLVAVNVLTLLYGAWAIRTAYSFSAIAGYAPDYPFQYSLIAELKKASLMEPSQPPPRVFVPPTLIPANYAMIYRYSTFDAYTSLFLRRPWDYLHAVLRVEPPPLRNTSVSPEVYQRGPLPYHDVSLSVAIDSKNAQVLLVTNPAPRAFLVYAGEVLGDYSSVLKRLSNGHDIHGRALLERATTPQLPHESTVPWQPVAISRFDPNKITLDVNAEHDALLLIAEAWYPGWKASVDGAAAECVPANLWMRGVPLSAGRHHVLVFFSAQRFLPGFIVSLLCGLASVFFASRAHWTHRRTLPDAGTKHV